MNAGIPRKKVCHCFHNLSSNLTVHFNMHSLHGGCQRGHRYVYYCCTIPTYKMHSTMTGLRGVFQGVFFVKDDKDRNIIGVVNVYWIKILV